MEDGDVDVAGMVDYCQICKYKSFLGNSKGNGGVNYFLDGILESERSSSGAGVGIWVEMCDGRGRIILC